LPIGGSRAGNSSTRCPGLFSVFGIRFIKHGRNEKSVTSVLLRTAGHGLMECFFLYASQYFLAPAAVNRARLTATSTSFTL
jgi:hypothetical protein